MTVIALDVMSGDLGAQECVPAAVLALASDPDLRLLLVGDPAAIEAGLAGMSAGMSARRRCEIVPATEIITMEDSPLEAIRRAKADIPDALAASYAIGEGHSPVHHFFALWPHLGQIAPQE